MALDFPASPVNGQVYGNWIYSTAKGAWQAKPLEGMVATPSPTAPLNPSPGDLWFNTNDGTTYVFYNDGDTSQWVESVAPVTANGYYSPNYIINGGFDIWQRGAGPFTGGIGIVRGADMWRTYAYAANAATLQQVAFTAGSAPVSGYEGQYFIRANSTNNRLWVGQTIEDVRTLAGQTATLSFWAKSATAQSISIEFYQAFGAGGSADVATTVTGISIGTSWQRYSTTLTIPSVSGKTVGTNSSLAVNFLAAINNTFDIWGVQLESGSTATPFRRNANSLQGELAACQRYYVRINAQGTYTAFAWGYMPTTTTAYVYLPLPTEMRVATSTLDWTGITTHYTISGVAISTLSTSASYNTKTHIRLAVGLSGSKTDQSPAELRSENTTVPYLGFSAEL